MNDRLQIAAMLLQGVVTHGYIGDVTDNNIGLCVELTDTLLAECGEPKRVEVTVVERLLEDLLVTIDDFGEKEHIEDLRETDAMQCAFEYVKAKYSAINGADQ